LPLFWVLIFAGTDWIPGSISDASECFLYTSLFCASYSLFKNKTGHCIFWCRCHSVNSTYSSKLLNSIGFLPEQSVRAKIYKGKGCASCAQTGYKGRLSIAEAIHVTRGFKDIIAKGFDRGEVDKELAKQKFITMEQDGVIKALLGMTTIEEIMRVSKM